MLGKLLFSFVTGIMLVLICARYDPIAKQAFFDYMRRSCERAYDCTITFKDAEWQLLQPRLIIKNLQVTPHDGSDQWAWQCDEYMLRMVCPHPLRSKMVNLHLHLHNVRARSALEGGALAIAPHLDRLLEDPATAIPATLKSIRITGSNLTITTPESRTHIGWQSNSRKIGNKFVTDFRLANLACHARGHHLIDAGAGHLRLAAHHHRNRTSYTAQMSGTMCTPVIEGAGRCQVTGSWDGNSGSFCLRDENLKLCVDPTTITRQTNGTGFRLTARVPATAVAQLIGAASYLVPVSSSCSIAAHGTFGQESNIQGRAAWHHENGDDIGKVSFAYNGQQWRGHCVINTPLQAELNGTWHYRNDGSANLQLANTNHISHTLMPHWRIEPGGAQLQVVHQDGLGTTIQHSCCANESLRNTRCHSSGTIDIAGGTASLCGSVGTCAYVSSIDLQRTPYLDWFKASTADGDRLLEIAQQESGDGTLEIQAPINTIRTITSYFLDHELQGDGTFIAQVGPMAHGQCPVHVRLDHGVVRLPQTHNFIDGLEADGTYETGSGDLTLRRVACSLHNGFVSAQNARFTLGANSVSLVYLPLTLDRCLLNLKQELYASVSGALTLHTTDSAPLGIEGFIILERAQLKENIFSQEFQKKVLRQSTSLGGNVPPIPCSITIGTRDPIAIDTGFLKTDARATLTISNTLAEPHLRGTISLSGGSLSFPYKPLHISSGSVTFLPMESRDPAVQLTAQNRVRQYDVRLHLEGSLLDPQVILETTPPLAQEQIVSLLLVGADEGALNLMAPALLVQNARDLLFGSHKPARLTKNLASMLGPFKISFVPSFTDQTGRGGLRGTIEISAYDRWRALIQRNFSLSEDTRFELEYLASDDVSVRAIRDERRDIGGEVEMRWKF